MKHLTDIHYHKEVPPERTRNWKLAKLREEIIVDMQSLISLAQSKKETIVSFHCPLNFQSVKDMIARHFPALDYAWRTQDDGSVRFYLEVPSSVEIE